MREGSSSRPATAVQVKRMEYGAQTKVQLDARSRRVLTALASRGRLSKGELARAISAGPRTCRRTLIPLLDGGLVTEGAGGFLSLTPLGHRRARA